MALPDSRTRRIQVTQGIVVALLCWLVVSVLYLAGLFRPFDLRLQDLRFRLRGERPAADQIALVGVDDATIRAYGGWPLPRDHYALLLESLEEARARAIGVDLRFPSVVNQEEQSNRLLAYVAGSHANIAQAIWFQTVGADFQDDVTRPTEVLDAVTRHGVIAEGVKGTAAVSVELPYDELVLNAPAMGHIDAYVDPDGAIRRLPLLIRYGDRLYPALTLCVFGLSHGEARLQGARPARGGIKVRWPRGPEMFIPADRDGATSIDYAGDRTAFRNTYSMLEVLQWKKSGDLRRIRDAFAGKLVLLGLTSRQEDVGTTPFSTATPLLYIHANVLDNLLRGRFQTRAGDPAYLGALAAVAVALGIVTAIFPLPVAAGLVAVAVMIVAALNFLLFAAWSVDVPIVAGLLLPPLTYAGAQGYRYVFLERRSRQREHEIREGMSVQQEFLPEAIVGKTLSHYLVLELIERGGMGVVYRGTDRHLARDVAIKVLPGGMLSDEHDRRRFRREARTLSKLSHPGIAALYDFDTQDGVDFIVMEYVPGISVAKRIGRGPLPEREAVAIAIQVTEALAEAHSHGIIHRDIKPGNVVLTPTGNAKLLDFGLARIVFSADGSTTPSSLTESGHVVGTLPYLAPEILQAEKADAWTDVYGVGILLFEMTTGKRPFDSDKPHELMYMILNEPVPRPRGLNGKLSLELEAVVLRTLRKDPAARFSTASGLLASLRGLDHGKMSGSTVAKAGPHGPVGEA